MVSLMPGCATVPETGRSQLILISPEQETTLGIEEFDKLKKSVPISKDKDLNEMVKRVGKRIAAVAPLPNAEWEFVLFDQPETPNAFCLPGGKVGIFTGILPVTKNEAGLAAVMGHEVAHAVARHGAERLSRAVLVELGGSILDSAIQTSDPTMGPLINKAYSLGANLGVMLPYSRSNELEADHLGLIYMARAGYDPREAVKFWMRFRKFKGTEEKRFEEFLSTHPLDSRRIKQLESLLPEAMEEYNKARRK